MDTIAVSFTVNFEGDAEGDTSYRDPIILEQLVGQVANLNRLFDTGIMVSPATAVSSVSGTTDLLVG